MVKIKKYGTLFDENLESIAYPPLKKTFSFINDIRAMIITTLKT